MYRKYVSMHLKSSFEYRLNMLMISFSQVFISIGANVVAGLSVYYIAKLFDKIFSAKSQAKKDGCELEITVTIQDKVHIKNVESTIEIEKALEIALTKKQQE